MDLYFNESCFHEPVFDTGNRADIAVIGLAVMGQNLILNMNDHGFVVSLPAVHVFAQLMNIDSLSQVCAFNRTTSKVDHFLANEAKGTKVVGAHSLGEMVSKLKKPRRVMLMVQGMWHLTSF